MGPRDMAHSPCHICTGIGLTPCHICIATAARLCSIFGQNDTANVGVALEVTVIQVSSPHGGGWQRGAWRYAQRGAWRYAAVTPLVVVGAQW